VSLTIQNNNIFAGTDTGVFMSTINGSSWTSSNAGHPYILGALTINVNYIFAGSTLGVWRLPLSKLSIKENTLNNISIYPNPTKDNLTIETNSNTEQRLEITNLIGQTVYTSIINKKKATINTSSFANGVYILKLSSVKEMVVRKFVKE